MRSLLVGRVARWGLLLIVAIGAPPVAAQLFDDAPSPSAPIPGAVDAVAGLAAGQNFICKDYSRYQVHRTFGNSFRISPDARHVGTVVNAAEGKQLALLDDTAGAAYEFVSGIEFTSDSAHWYYHADNDKQRVVILDGHVIQDATDIAYSPDARRVAVVRSTSNDGSRVLVENQLSKSYQSISELTFSPDSRHLAYRAQVGNTKYRIVLDGRESTQTYDYPSDLKFSPDGSRLAFKARASRYQVAVFLDGKEGPPFSAVEGIVFSADGKRIAYVGKNIAELAPRPATQLTTRPRDEACYVVDGVPQKMYRDVGHALFSADGRRFAYKAYEEKACRAVIDGQKSKAYAYIASVPVVAFSADGRHAAFVAKADGGYRVVVDGVEGKTYGDINQPAYTADGKLVYRASLDGGDQCMVVDGNEGPHFSYASHDLTFSSDRQHFAYVGFTGTQTVVVVDTIELSRYPKPGDCNVAFTPDNQPLVIVWKENADRADLAQTRWFVDFANRQSRTFPGRPYLSSRGPAFAGPRQVYFTVETADGWCRAQVDLASRQPPAPAAAESSPLFDDTPGAESSPLFDDAPARPPAPRAAPPVRDGLFED